MNSQPSSIRIRGLVRLMNRVRDQLRAGVPVEEVDDMRTAVHDAVRAVEQICRRHGITTEQLPAPSRRAYGYLRDLVRSGALDDAHLLVEGAEPVEGPGPPSSAIELSGIVATCGHYHREFAALVDRTPAAEGSFAREQIARLASRMRADTEAIKALCEESDGTPADLPAPSRRGYGWLRYLSEPKALTRHLETQKRFTVQAQKVLALLPSKQRARSLQVRLYATAVLYRTRLQGQVYQITLNEGFVGAPRQIINALARATLDEGRTGRRASDVATTSETIRSYAKGDDFAAIQSALHDAVLTPTYHAVGQYHDLNLAFERVNTEYFEGKLDRPHMEWSRTRTRRKLGHYDNTRDTVMVSQTLDAAGVPEYVVDFVVYHELLHKTMGTPLVKGRRRVHTSGFRQAERSFRQYAEAREFISKLTTHTKAEP
jgi:hypothetical protein